MVSASMRPRQPSTDELKEMLGKGGALKCRECGAVKVSTSFSMGYYQGSDAEGVCEECFRKQNIFHSLKGDDEEGFYIDYHISEGYEQTYLNCKHVRRGRWPNSKMLPMVLDTEGARVCYECIAEKAKELGFET